MLRYSFSNAQMDQGMPPYSLQRTHHLHIVETDSNLWEHLLFRDYLRSHSEEVQRYAASKQIEKLISKLLWQRHAHHKTIALIRN